MDTRLNVPLAVVRELVDRARLAPSTHNTQPWSWTVVPCTEVPTRACGVELHRIPDRTLALGDPGGRELVISCGAALLTLRVAAAEHLLATLVEILPDPDRPDLLARVSFVDGAVDAAFSGLDAAIPVRHTWRREFGARGLPAGLLARLDAEAAAEGARLAVVGPDDRAVLVRLVRASGRDLYTDPQRRAELAGWLRPRRRGDGIPTPLLGLLPARLALRGGLVGRGIAARDAQLLRAAPAVVMLVTQDDSVRTWLAAGQALQRILLVAAAQGVAAGFGNGPCQDPRCRTTLRGLLPGGGYPQVVMRLGYPAGPGRAVPRRSLEDLLVWPVAGRTGNGPDAPPSSPFRPTNGLDVSEDELG